jgi:hypothetical protein
MRRLSLNRALPGTGPLCRADLPGTSVRSAPCCLQDGCHIQSLAVANCSRCVFGDFVLPRGEAVNRKQRSQDELHSASDHLHYEIWMFTSPAHGLASGISDQSVINNALLESYTLHARILLDFLYAERPKEDDVRAEDFFEDLIKWHNAKPQKPEKV